MSHAENVKYKEGDIVPFKLNSGIVVASFFVSLLGAFTTVELLHRRTTWRGWLSRIQLVACSVSMGLISIWCMHFVGNSAISMGHGEAELQLSYNRGYTTASVFLPVLALFVAFYVADMRSSRRKWLFFYLVVSGVIAGLAILGMHYVGNAGIANYRLSYTCGYIWGAMVIACVSSIFALTLFFLLQDFWMDRLIYRFLCAVVLAGAVSGMHFEASMGTRYRLIHLQYQSKSSRATNVIVATVLCILTIPACVATIIYSSRRRRRLADRAQMVVLASATFDPDGKIMVTPEGRLPCRLITKQRNDRAFDNEFNVAHPAFHWIFRVTHNWHGVVDLIPGMRQHLRSGKIPKDESRRKPSVDTIFKEEEQLDDASYSVVFREGFCVAAFDLAADMQESLPNLGTLYDGVMMTGTLMAKSNANRRKSHWSFMGLLRGSDKRRDSDEEKGLNETENFSKGQLLFVVRQANNADALRLTSAGYRFASLERIGEHMARGMRVPTAYLASNLADVREHTQRQKTTPHYGSFLACFALRTTFVRSRWEVAVPSNRPDLLPHIQLSQSQLKPWQMELLVQLDGWSVSRCLEWLSEPRETIEEEKQKFYEMLRLKTEALKTLVGEPFFDSAVFSSKIVHVPRYSLDRTGNIGKCSLLVFHVIPDVHTSSLTQASKLSYTSLSLFKTRQQVAEGAPDHAIFARKIHQEFGPLAVLKPAATSTSRCRVKRTAKRAKHSLLISWLHRYLLRSPKSRSSSVERIDSGCYSKQEAPRSITEASAPTPDNERSNSAASAFAIPVSADPPPYHLPFGGILVSSELEVDVETVRKPVESHAGTASSLDDAPELGTKGQASAADVDGCLFVDALFTTAVTKWRKS